MHEQVPVAEDVELAAGRDDVGPADGLEPLAFLLAQGLESPGEVEVFKPS